MPRRMSSVLRITVGLAMLATMAPRLGRPLISDLALVAAVRAYHLQEEECRSSALVSGAAPIISAAERLALLVAGVDPYPGELNLQFGPQDFSFEETWTLQLRELGADFGAAAPPGAPSPFYLRFWSNASARVSAQIRPGCYQVTIVGMEGAPGPVLLKVTANHRPVGDLWFCRSDNTWSEQSLILTPSFWLVNGEPTNELILDFAFANDGPDERGLRDAGVLLVKINSIDCTPSRPR